MKIPEKKRKFGIELRKARLRLGMGQATLARRVGVHRQAVWFWEHGYRMPDLGRIQIICNVLAIDSYVLIQHMIDCVE